MIKGAPLTRAAAAPAAGDRRPLLSAAPLATPTGHSARHAQRIEIRSAERRTPGEPDRRPVRQGPALAQAVTAWTAWLVPVGAQRDTKDNAYGYDAAGNTTTRDIDNAGQSLSWDDEGHLASSVNADGTTTSYLYDADGNRLLSRDANGTTLYLGDTEVHLAKGTTTSATRYYSWLGQTIAEHSTGTNLQWVLDDAHDTATAQIDATTQAVQYQRTDPFGNDRGSAPDSWTGDHGFVGGVQDDSTGLTHLGARDYDSTTGRFISLDPVLELTDPQQVNGYSYAAGNPVTGADPDGLMPDGDKIGGGACTGACADFVTGQTTSSSGSSHSGGSHHCSRWNLSCKAKKAVHSVTHVIVEHPVIAVVVAVTVVAVAGCVVVSEGACLAALPNVAQAFNEGLAFGGGTAGIVSAAVTATAESTAEVVGVAASSAATGVVTAAAETVAKEESAASSGAKAAASAADETTSSGASSGAKRAGNASPKTGPKECSFAPQTPILLADGKTKPIGQLQAGDKVESADPDTGTLVGPKTVTSTHVKHDTDLADVTVRGEDGKRSTIHTTSNHPFYDATTHQWTLAGKLPAGDTLVTPTGQHVTILTAQLTFGAANRYNLTVADLHTYYVVAGATPVLVHNCDEASDELLDIADANIGHTNTASEIVSADGKVGYGVSGARAPSALSPRVRAAAEATGHHRGCSEIGALCELELKGADLAGTKATTVKVMGGSQEYGPEVHGELYPKCPSCKALFDFLDGN